MQIEARGYLPENVEIDNSVHDETQNLPDSPALQELARLRGRSNFDRREINQGVVELKDKNTGEMFFLERVDHGRHPLVEGTQALLEDIFNPEEVDSIDTLRDAIDGIGEDIIYKVFTIRDETGHVVSTFTGGHLPILGEKNIPTGESMFMVAYAATSKEKDEDENEIYRRRRFSTEGMISAMEDTIAEAEEMGTNLISFIGECTSTSEDFWNSLGMRRPYGERKVQTTDKPLTKGEPENIQPVFKRAYGERKAQEIDTGLIKDELEYVQPAVEYNVTTGRPAQGAGEAPEHIMMILFGQNEVSPEKYEQMINAIYKWCNEWGRQSFRYKESFETHVEYVKRFKTEMKDFLASHGSISLLTRAEREEERAQGIVINDHIAADRKVKEAGPQDF